MRDIILSPPDSCSHWLQLYLLYRRSFPRAERKPFGFIRKAYRQGKTDIWCILRDGTFLGFAATMNSPRLVMLDYLAVLKPYRGQGIGSIALKDLMRQ